MIITFPPRTLARTEEKRIHLILVVILLVGATQAFLNAPYSLGSSKSSAFVPRSPLFAAKKTTQQHAPYRLGVHPYLKHKYNKNHPSQEEKNVEQNITTPSASLHPAREIAVESFSSNTTLNATRRRDLTVPTVTVLSNATALNATKNATTIPRREATLTARDALKTNKTTIPETKKRSKTKIKRTSSTQPQPFFSMWSLSLEDMSKKKPKRVNGKMTSSKTNATSDDDDEVEGERLPVTPDTLVSKKKADQILTVADLEVILRDQGYVRESDLLDSILKKDPSAKSKAIKTSGKMAFPQTSVLSYKGLMRGSTVSAGFLGTIVGITIMPNLWLVGMALGSLYGYEISKDYSNKPPTNLLSKLVIGMGRHLAKSCLRVYDFVNGIWFMYKTGQLSYEYYKGYSKLDERFGIQDKMDAWNARFQEGKKNFDRWEKENEIGRRALASLRTVWLVNEKSRRKYGRESKYRIVQGWYDVTGWFRRLFVATYNAITGGGSSELASVLKGIRINISESRMQEIGPRIGASMVAVFGISVVGALYSLAPRMLALLAMITGVIWPTWVREFVDRVQALLEEFKAKGRGEEMDAGIPATALSQFRMYDKKRYSYYRRQDGTRRWYRTGQPAFRGSKSDDKRKSRGLLGRSEKKTTTKATTTKPKTTKSKTTKQSSGKKSGQWGIFGR